MTTFGTEKENLAALKDYVEYLEKRHGLTVKVVRSDYELFMNRTRKWLEKRRLTASPQRQEHSSKTDLLSAQGVW
jgi:hypothetical protein